MRAKVDKVVSVFLVFLMAVMTVDVLWGVFTRYAVGNQAEWSEELARFLLIWIGTLGAGYAAGQHMHLAIDLLRPKLSEEGQRKLSALIYLCILFFVVCILVVGGFRLIYVTYVLGQLSAALRVPMYVVYTVLPLSGLLIIYYHVNDLLALRRQKNAT